MSLKQEMLQKIKSISDPKLLRELDVWIDEAAEKKQMEINEPVESNSTKKHISRSENRDTDSDSAVDYLEKIAESGGVKNIVDQVKWQRQERDDRSLNTF